MSLTTLGAGAAAAGGGGGAPTFADVAVFSGSQNLTTSFADVATKTLDPANYTLPGGYELEYRWAAAFSGIANADLGDLGEYRASPGVYQSSVGLVHGGFLDEAGYGWFLDGSTPTGAVWASAGNVTLDGTGGLVGPALWAPQFTAEAHFTRGRTGVVEAVIGAHRTGGTAWLLYLDGSNKLNLLTAGNSGTGTTAVTGGPHKVAVVYDGTTFAAYLNGTREVNLTTTVLKNQSQNVTFRVGCDENDANRMLGTAHAARFSNSARYSGSSYSPPSTLTADANTLALWTFPAAPPARTGVTGWMPFPASSTATTLRARNLTSARGTITGITLQLRGVTS